MDKNNLSNLLLGIGIALALIGGIMFFADSNDYNKAIEAAGKEAKEYDFKPQGVFGGTKTYHTEQANAMQKLAKETYETERTKDFLIIGAGVLAGIAGIAVRNKSGTTH
jgi:hypothetical protein